MGQTQSVFAVVVLALIGANLPFLSQRLFGFYKLKVSKNLALRLFELVVFFFAVGGVGLFLEQNLGQIAPQKWEFYAVAACVFLTFAFPGFVWRYLIKHYE